MRDQILAVLSGRGNLIVGFLKLLYGLRLIPSSAAYSLGLVDRPEYAFGMLEAARYCNMHGISGFTAIEFGVAGGNGLLAMENHAAYLEKEFGLDIDVFGFDSGIGMPEPRDHRDIPYLWKKADFSMDVEKLENALTNARLVLGEVADTVPNFNAALLEKPLGFISFDLDYYSSTICALELVRLVCIDKTLPRVKVHFDDVDNCTPFQGELLAINDFNELNPNIRIARPNLLEFYVPFRPFWSFKSFEIHFLESPQYPSHDGSDRQLKLD